jgi:hypothetical protein
MTIQDFVEAGEKVGPYAAVFAGGLFLQRLFNVVGFLASFFQKKPDLTGKLLELMDDIKNKQPILDNILDILTELKQNVGPTQSKVG